MLRAFRFEKIPRVDISIFSLTLGSQTLSNELAGKNRAVAAYVASCDGSNEKGEFLSTFWLLAPGGKNPTVDERERERETLYTVSDRYWIGGQSTLHCVPVKARGSRLPPPIPIVTRLL